MFSTRIRPACAAALAVACLALPGAGRSQDKPLAPPPRPATDDKKAPAPTDWDAQFAGRSPDEVLAALDALAQKWGARKGAYELARRNLEAQAREAAKLKSQAAEAEPPEVKPPLVLRTAADFDAALKAEQQLAEYHASRARLLDAARAARGALEARDREFERAAIGAHEHLMTMQEAARAAKTVPADKLPAAFDPKQLASAVEQFRQDSEKGSEAGRAARTDLDALAAALKDARDASAKADAALDQLKQTRETTLAALALEEQAKGLAPGPLVDRFNQLRKELAARSAAIKGDEADYKKVAGPVAEARAKIAAVQDPLPRATVPGAALGPLETAAWHLGDAQQYLAARARATAERAAKAGALVTALEAQEAKAVAYSTTLDGVRATAGQLAAVAAEIERRVGRGELEPDKVPGGTADAIGDTGHRAKLDAEFAGVRTALADLRKELAALRKSDAETEAAKALTAALLANVNERIDLHTDLKKLAADYALARANRPEAEQKRLDQRAAERLAKEGKEWDALLALDRSQRSADGAALLGAYYKELVELDEKADNLKRQKDALDKLVELTRKEEADVAKLRDLLGGRLAEKSAGREGAEPTAKFHDWLGARLAPEGLKAEADVYHAEAARLAALGGADARRVQALTGNEQAKLAAGGGIAQARNELLEARARGLVVLGIKIAVVLLAALVLPRLLTRGLRRAIRDDAGNPSPVLRPLRGALRLVVWAVAIAVILNVLGYDVTGLVVAIAIGVLAAALAARPMIADILGSVAISAERRFKVGDVVRLGGEQARVVGLTWRSVSLKNANGTVSTVPNRAVAEATVENLSRGAETYDTLAVTVSTDKDAGKVINVIRAALAQCKNLSPDQGVTVVSYNQRGPLKVVQYRFWWFLKDYETRNKTRDEVFARIAVGLAHEDMTGIEIALA